MGILNVRMEVNVSRRLQNRRQNRNEANVITCIIPIIVYAINEDLEREGGKFCADLK